MCNEAPDTSKADATADKLAGLSQDQWDWVKTKYEEMSPDREHASWMSRAVGERQLNLMDRQIALGDEAAANYRRIYQPLEEKQASDAANYNTEDHASQLAGRAQADVQHAFSTSRDVMQRNMASYGINPGDAGFMDATGDLQRQQALAEAGARTDARMGAETMGRALVSDAIGTGRGVMGSQATTAGLALNAGSGAVNSGVVPVNVGQGGVNMVGQAAGQAANGLSAAGNIYSRSADQQAQVSQGNSSGMGAMVGAGMTAAAIF